MSTSKKPKGHEKRSSPSFAPRRLVPLAPESGGRRPGRLKGRVGDDFFEPLPEEELAAWEIATKQRLGKLSDLPALYRMN